MEALPKSHKTDLTETARDRRKSMDTPVVAIATTATLLAAALYAYLQRRQSKASDDATVSTLSEPATSDGAIDEPASNSPAKKKRSNKPKAAKQNDAATAALAVNDEVRNQLPPIPAGTRCWHRLQKVHVTIAKVYYDDPPPYYSVRFADGTERNTVRARLDTLEERAAELKAAELKAAEERAEAAAAALLAEEEQKQKQKGRKPKSR